MGSNPTSLTKERQKMASKVKVKVVVTLDSADQFLHENEERFDSNMNGHDLAEAIIKVASTTVSDVVREIVDDDMPA